MDSLFGGDSIGKKSEDAAASGTEKYQDIQSQIIEQDLLVP